MQLSQQGLRKVMLLFEEEKLSDEKKAQRKSIKAFAVKDKLDIKFFNANILIYQVNHPETKKPCLLCVTSIESERLLVIRILHELGKAKGDHYIVNGIKIYHRRAYDEQINKFLEA